MSSQERPAALQLIAFEVTAIRGSVVAPIDALAEVNAVLGAREGTRAKASAAEHSTRAELVVERHDDHVRVSAHAAAVANDTWWEADRFGLAADRTVVLEVQLPDFQRGVACHLTSEWWTEPRYCAAASDVPARSQFMLWQNTDGRYGAIVPLVGDDGTCYLEGTSHGVAVVASTCEDRRLRADLPMFVHGEGADPFALVARLYEAALHALGRPAKLRTEKPFPACFENIGWCTWDAFYRDVTEEGIERQLNHFSKLGLPVGFLLIDDGWYPMHENQLVDVRVDPARFPNGLAPVVDKARSHGIKHVGVWHALTGYWCGIADNHTLPDTFRPHLQKLASEYGPSTDLEHAFAFYEHWHRALAQDGVDFVKVDGQGAMHRYSRNRMPIGLGARNVQKGLQASVGANFGGQILNCMSMRHELMWQWGMANLARSSNDYMIEGKQLDPGRHAQINVANAVYFSQLSWCDFDMFRTDQPHAEFHMNLRAVSGGPVYISDAPQVTRPEVLWPLMLSSGRLLRCDEVGVPTEDCLLVDARAERLPLKVQNRAGDAAIVGVFHVSGGDAPVAGVVAPRDVRGLAGDAFAVWSHADGRGRRMSGTEGWQVQLAPAASQVFVVAPIRDGFAPIGIVDKIVAPKTISMWRQRQDAVRLLLLEGGSFVAYCETRPRQVSVEGRSVPFVHEDGWLQLRVVAPKDVGQGGAGGSIELTIAFAAVAP